MVHLAGVKSRSGSSASDGDAYDEKPGAAGAGCCRRFIGFQSYGIIRVLQ